MRRCVVLLIVSLFHLETSWAKRQIVSRYTGSCNHNQTVLVIMSSFGIEIPKVSDDKNPVIYGMESLLALKHIFF